MPPRARKAALTVHLVTSLGWVGAVVCVLVLAVVALGGDDPAVSRAAFPLMETLGRFVLVPLSLASLLTGIVQSLGTPWGLLRHYWVVVKLVLTVVATAVLLLYLRTLGLLADIATTSAPPPADLALLGSPTVVVHSGAALVVLLTATVLAVFKPRGRTRYGRRRDARHPPDPPRNAPGHSGPPVVDPAS